MLVSEFDYELPTALIAQHPARKRSASRLLRLHASGAIEDLSFADMPGLVGAGDAVVLNDTKVIRARLSGRKASGGKIELFIERVLGPHEALALIRASHPPSPGSELTVGEDAKVRVEGRVDDLYRVRFADVVMTVLDRFGAVPLPPYITHQPAAEDVDRYQTIYASVPGAVAAPTAGLHFDPPVLQAIQARGATVAKLTLHVGAGTFQPVRAERVEEHHMHKERYFIPKETVAALEGKRVLAVGTTALRALESAARSGALEGETDLFIYPGYEFRSVSRLLTNFHLPKSTLLMLVCAFAGKERVLEAYHHAIRERYRFFSYGDAMLIER